MSKKINGFEKLGSVVFSTKPNFKDSEEGQDKLEPSSQLLQAHFSNKGRGGKTVTIIKGFFGSEQELKRLAKLLKTTCSVGGSVKDGEIVIQGNIRNKLVEILKNEGYNVKLVGG